MFLIIWLCCGIAAAMVASSKGRSTGGWFFLGILLGPFGLIFALLAGKEGPAQGERKCPFCAEFIKKEAVVCKHCGRDLPGQEASTGPTRESDDAWVPLPPTLFAGKKIEMVGCPKCGAKITAPATKCGVCGWEPMENNDIQ